MTGSLKIYLITLELKTHTPTKLSQANPRRGTHGAETMGEPRAGQALVRGGGWWWGCVPKQGKQLCEGLRQLLFLPFSFFVKEGSRVLSAQTPCKEQTNKGWDRARPLASCR